MFDGYTSDVPPSVTHIGFALRNADAVSMMFSTAFCTSGASPSPPGRVNAPVSVRFTVSVDSVSESLYSGTFTVFCVSVGLNVTFVLTFP